MFKLSQCVLKPQIDVKMWSISWDDITRPDFDIVLMSNCNYMDINTWGQYDVKNVSRKWPLTKTIAEKEFWLIFFFNVRHQFGTNSWRQFDVDSICYKIFQLWPVVDINCSHHFCVNAIFFTHCGCGKMSALCLVLIYFSFSIRALVEVKHAYRI